jgi:hypothetical protein
MERVPLVSPMTGEVTPRGAHPMERNDAELERLTLARVTWRLIPFIAWL